MTREEQLTFCKKCLNRKMDLKQGLICSLTEQRAAFQDECSDFKIDNTVKEVPLEKDELLTNERIHGLSPEIVEEFRMDQRLLPGIIFGAIVGAIGAILWGIITVTTNFQIGYMAIAIGAGVGFAIRKVGKGIDPIFGVWGAGISFLSVVLGNFLSIIGFVANLEGLGYLETLIRFDYSFFPAVMKESFNFMDLVFYGIAIYEGYKFSFRIITKENILDLQKSRI